MLPSTRHTLYQVTFRNKFRKPSNHDILEIHKSTKAINVQQGQFSSTSEALKQIYSSNESCIIEKLTMQSLMVKFRWEFVNSNFINQWPSVIIHLPQNIFSFTTCYLNNTSENGTNVIKQGMTNGSSCMFCDQQQTLGHVISVCRTVLLESTENWRHGSILLNTLSKQKGSKLLKIQRFTRIHQ